MKYLNKLVKPVLIMTSTSFSVSSCAATSSADQVTPSQSVAFKSVNSQFKFENKNLRKWDVATVADLDQDGYPDLLLNDHGFSLKILWNNKGNYSKPYDLLMGDMHGLAAADFDKDGQIELIIARGGGSGSNSRNAKIFRFSKDRKITDVKDFSTPLAHMRGRTVKWVDLDQDGWLDLINFAFPSKEMKGQSENYLYINTKDGQLVERTLLPAVNADGQKTLVTDFNQDGLPDLLMYGNGPVKAYQAESAFNYQDVSNSILPNPILHTTSIAEIDFDNDGDFDLVITRGEEFKNKEIFYDQQKQLLGYHSKRGLNVLPPFKAGDVINFENMQSQWPSKDLWIGESAYGYEFPGETHSGRDIRLVNSDALGFAEQFDKKGAYIGYIGNQQWQFAVNTWSPSTGVIKGVESVNLEKPTNQKAFRDVILENRNGQFVDVTTKLNFTHDNHTTSSAIADINNDGYSDIVVVQRGDLIHDNAALVYLNQQGKSLKRIAEHGVITNQLGEIGLGIEKVDFDLDGRVDLLIGHDRGKWNLFKNQQTGGNYLQVKVQNSSKAKASPIGAVVKLEACGLSQQQRVGNTSAAYSQSTYSVMHFGLGNCNQPIKVSVSWSNGEVKNKTVTKANQLIEL